MYRVLRPGGWFIVISVFEPRYVHHLLKCEGTNWENVHLPKSLTPKGWMETRAYCLKKPDTKEGKSFQEIDKVSNLELRFGSNVFQGI